MHTESYLHHGHTVYEHRLEVPLDHLRPRGDDNPTIELFAREVVRKVYVDDKILRYIVDLVFATREPEQVGLANLRPMILCGASPRASINLSLAARAYAFIDGRGYVLPEDVRAVAHDVLRHRIALSYEAEANELSSDTIVTEIINKVIVP